MKDWKAIATGLGAAGTITAIAFGLGGQPEKVVVDDAPVVVEQPREGATPQPFQKKCQAGEVTLKVDRDKSTGKLKEQVCLSAEDYQSLKTGLVNEYDRGGNYQFDINHREILGAVLNHEIEKNGSVSIQNVKSKDELARKLIDLLR